MEICENRNALQEIVMLELMQEIPKNIESDVNKRVLQWLASGGDADDTYIKNQLKYLSAVANKLF